MSLVSGMLQAALATSLALLSVLACGKPGWEPKEFGRRFPDLSGSEIRLLSDIHPYVLPTRGELVLFLCRWPDGWPIPVSIPADTSDAILI